MSKELLPEIIESTNFTVARMIYPFDSPPWLYVDKREQFQFSEYSEVVSECEKRNTINFVDNPFFVVEVTQQTMIRKVDS